MSKATTKTAPARTAGGNTRTITLSTSASAEEAATVEMAARAVGHSLAGFLRWSALRTAAQIKAETIVRA